MAYGWGLGCRRRWTDEVFSLEEPQLFDARLAATLSSAQSVSVRRNFSPFEIQVAPVFDYTDSREKRQLD